MMENGRGMVKYGTLEEYFDRALKISMAWTVAFYENWDGNNNKRGKWKKVDEIPSCGE